MQTLAGTMWRLIEARRFDETGRDVQPVGPNPMGFILFEADRILAAVVVGRTELPPGTAPRFFVAYSGTYRIDGDQIVTQADSASSSSLLADQVRRIRFVSATRMVVTPISGVPGQTGTELTWERVG